MTSRFEIGGHVSPVIFYLRHDEYVGIHRIANGAMSSNESKDLLVESIKDICQDPITRAAAFISEVNIRDEDGTKVADGLMMVFSSLEGEELKIYKVDCDSNKILGLHLEKNTAGMKVRFTGFFNKAKN